MSKKIIAIGGGENGRFLEDGTQTLYETEKIDKEIVNVTGKKNPNFLFLAHAMCFSNEIQQSYYETMKKIYGEKYGCDCKILKASDLNNKKYVNKLVDWADIIYEGGGDTNAMIKLWKENEFDILLKKAWQNGKVICGISAGAVCWFNSCNSDIEELGFEIIECLNWIDIFVTPHCNEKGRYESSKKQLKEKKCLGLMLSNCSAIEIIDDKFKIIYSDEKGYSLKCYWKNNKFYEERLEESTEFKMFNEVFNINN